MTGTPDQPQHGVRYFVLGDGLDYRQMREEISGYKDVLLGRADPPIDRGVMTLAEVANAYYTRALEIQMELQELENTGAILRGSNPYKFRTGYLRSFIDLAKGAYELGSRRVTMAQLEANERLG